MYATPYLNFDGNCAEAFAFYADVLGGKIDFIQKHSETPIAGDVPPEWGDLVMHARLIADGVDLMASDSPPGRHEPARGLWVSLHVEEPAEADRIFDRLKEGGQVTMPLERTFWAERFGMLVDRYGTPWMINCGGDVTYA